MPLQIIDNLLSLFKSPYKPSNDSQQAHSALIPVLQNSSGSIPPGAASTPNNIPANILAFRTLTTILSQLPRSMPIKTVNNLEGKVKDPDDCREIRISDAFAHLAIGEHDVAALTTNHSSPNGRQLHIMACASNVPVGESLPISTQPMNLTKIWCQFQRNFLQDSAKTSSRTPQPTTISPSEPDDVRMQDAFAYMVGLEQRW